MCSTFSVIVFASEIEPKVEKSFLTNATLLFCVWGSILNPQTFKELFLKFGGIFFLSMVPVGCQGVPFGAQRVAFRGQGITFGIQRVTFDAQRGHFLTSEVDSGPFWNRVGKRITKTQISSPRSGHFLDDLDVNWSHFGDQK